VKDRQLTPARWAGTRGLIHLHSVFSQVVGERRWINETHLRCK
jgi:hypothetical protein